MSTWTKTYLIQARRWLVFALICSTAYSQGTDLKPLNFWLSGGFGLSSLGHFGASTNLSAQYKNLIVSVRATENMEALLGGDRFYDYGVLAGYAYEGKDGLASLAIGIARVEGHRDEPGLSIFEPSPPREHIEPILGIPVEIQLIKKSWKYVGFSTYGYRNFNKQKSFWGCTFGLILGKLK